MEPISISLTEQKSFLLWWIYPNKDHIFYWGHFALTPKVKIEAFLYRTPLGLSIHQFDYPPQWCILTNWKKFIQILVRIYAF